MTGEQRNREPWRLRDHWGVMSGFLLGLIALGLLVLAAAAGDPGALGIILIAVFGTAMIFLGGQIHGNRSRRD